MTKVKIKNVSLSFSFYLLATKYKMKRSEKQERRSARHRRVRAKVKGTNERPRISVFRSNRHLVLQLIDDSVGRTLVAVNDTEFLGADDKSKSKRKSKKVTARAIGALLAKKAQERKIQKAVFDRGAYPYRGLVKEVAEGAREGGLQF